MKGMEKRRYLVILLAIMSLVIVYALPLPLQREAQATLAITIFAMILWISEVIPLHVTAMAVALLLILTAGFSPDKVFAQFFDRVIVLVLGGFALAVAMSKHKLDRYFAHRLLGKFNASSRTLLLGIIIITALLSMWVSNSAAAAIAMPIALVILAKNKMKPVKSSFGKSMVLAVAYGATIGGIGTIIGSTPNVMVQKFLNEKAIGFGFMDWAIRGFPFMIVMVLVCWIVLSVLFTPERRKVKIDRQAHPFTSNQKKVAAILGMIILLWVTEGMHGIHNSVVALLAIPLLYGFNLLDTKDFNKINWSALILIGGGIALGMAIDSSGLDDLLSSALHGFLAGKPYITILLALVVAGIIMTSFLSNTAASAVMVPIIITIATMFGNNVTNMVMAAAIGVSLDFIFPMGTPPSALAHGTGFVSIRDMMKAGVAISMVGALVLAGMAFFTWP